MSISKSIKQVTAAMAAAAILASPAMAEVVKVEIPVIEKEIAVDNKGTMQTMWTFGGTVPGPVVRVKEGDVVDFTLINEEGNKQSHSMDFHAAAVDVLDEFSAVKPGQKKHFKFTATSPGVFIYHCGADPMVEHIGRGMYGVIIVDPKEGYGENYPKPDREYVIVHSDLFEPGTTAEQMLEGDGWTSTLVNGKAFHYDPLHDPNASLMLQSEPGERVRFYFVNAHVNKSVALHPIAGIWERVYNSGHPFNLEKGIQTYLVPAASGATLDLVSPSDRDTNNAIVDHQMKGALNGGISVLMNTEGADPSLGKKGNILIR
ncbi:multicopper oxidase domain-containing protein [Marinobacter sp.]|uniref:multicopper oxidase domain-containing protein n=1 Tax=Marinobacter sp. TaxID=50741 RepID=UPI003A93F08E